MNWKNEWKPLAMIIAVFVACYYLPVDWLQQSQRVENALWESLHLVKWYAQEHVLLCLVPAFFIAGAVGVFVSQAAVMKYLGPKANKVLAYSVASVSGGILAVCSCTILPLFAGIYRMGAGLGPASAFLYAGPAINILAIVLTASVLGPQMGAARALGAVTFSIHPGDCPDCLSSWPADGDRASYRRRYFFHRGRHPHAFLFSQRGAGKGRGRSRHAGARSHPPPLAERSLLCQHGRHPGCGRTPSSLPAWSASWSLPTGVDLPSQQVSGTPFMRQNGPSQGSLPWHWQLSWSFSSISTSGGC